MYDISSINKYTLIEIAPCILLVFAIIYPVYYNWVKKRLRGLRLYYLFIYLLLFLINTIVSYSNSILLIITLAYTILVLGISVIYRRNGDLHILFVELYNILAIVALYLY